MDILLDELRTYARCPLAWFWERRAGAVRPQTVADLLPEALRTALGFFYGSHAPDLSTAVGLVWQDWCEAWGEPAAARDLAQYAVGRAKVLDLFATGRVHRPDGGRYTAPQMTNEYRTRMHSAGLTSLGRKLDEFARTHGLLLPDDGDRPGSALGDVFADCLIAAERVAPDLPVQSVVLGWQVPYQLILGEHTLVRGEADLLLRTPADDGMVVMEVHDFEPAPWVRAGLASRDLRVIAASLAQPAPVHAEQNGPSWERVEQVVYRHWSTGQAFTFRETSTGHLLALVSAMVRGMQHHVVIPRAVTGYESCRACAYREHCWGQPGWEALPLVDAGLLGWAEQHRAAFQKLRQAADADLDAVDHLRGALPILERVLSDLPGVSLITAARQILEAADDDRP